MARWLDLDQDGDLDLYVVNYCAAEHADKAFLADQPPPPGLANSVYRNDGQPEPIPGSPAPAWAPLAVAWENVKSKSGLSLALVPWTGVEPLLGGDAPHSGIAVLDVDGDRDLDLVLTADGSAPLAASTTGWATSTRSYSRTLPFAQPVSGLLVTDLDQDGRADLVAPSTHGKLLPLRNTTERIAADQTRITFEPLATSAGALAGGDRGRSRPGRLARPGRAAGGGCSSPRGRHARTGLGPERGQAAHRARAARDAGDPRGGGPGPCRPGRRSASRPAGRPRRRGPRRGPQPGQRPPLAGPATRRPLAGQARADAYQLARHRHPGNRRGAGDSCLIRPHNSRFRPRPVDRSGGRRPGQTSDRRPGSPALARRRDAMRAQRPQRRQAGARREQPQDGQLPGAFHVER